MAIQLQEIAQNYALRGWPVLPLYAPNGAACTCGALCSSPGKHPRINGGVHAASTDTNAIRSWWSQWPGANIGIATGRVSDLVVIDLDERHGGIDSWKNWERDHTAKTNLVAKSGGGFHLYFSAQGQSIRSRASVLPGVDVRADGGYIVAAGSLHYTGAIYAWACAESNKPSPLPAALLALLEGKRLGAPSAISEISQGRNDFLTRVAGLLRRENCDPALILRALDGMNQAICSPALDQAEVQKIASGIQRYAPKWGEIVSPVGESLKAPSLDTNFLPQALRGWVEDAAERMQVPPEFFAAPCLVAFASVVGRQTGVYPKQEDSWFEVPNLWGAIVARPGLFKSPAILEATSFVRTLAENASLQYEKASVRADICAESLKSQLEGQKEAIKKAARGQKAEAEIEKIEDQMQILRERLNESSCVHRRYLVNDSTVEKIGTILKDNPNGLLLLRDELAGWAAVLKRREGDREFFLEAWNGKGSFTVDRIGRGTVHVPHLCLSIFGGIQPSKLHILGAAPGTGSDGLLQRFQILVYPEMPKAWKNIDRKPKEAEYRELAQTFAKAGNLDALYPHAKEGLRFVPEAQELFNSWRCALEHRLRSGELDSEDFEAHLAKYRRLVPCLSLLFEIIQALSQGAVLSAISVDNLHKALSWAAYLERHAAKVYQEELSLVRKGALLLARKIKSGAVKDGDSLRAIYRRHWTGLDTPEKLEKSLEALEDCCWVALETVVNHTGKSTVVRINPKVDAFPLAG